MKVELEREMDILPQLSHISKIEKRIVFKTYAARGIQFSIWNMSRMSTVLDEIALFEQIRYTPEKELIDTLIKQRICLSDYLNFFPHKKNLDLFERIFEKHAIFSCITPNQYSLKNGDNACTAICLAAAFYFIKREWTFFMYDLPWSDIFSFGIDIWKHVYSNSKEENKCLYQSFIEVYNCERSNIIQNTLKPYEKNWELYGRVFSEGNSENNTISLEEVFATLQSMTEEAALILNIGVFTFVIFFTLSDPKALWFFDSHGMFQEGKSDLIRFSRVDKLVQYLRLYFANLQKIKKDDLVKDAFSSFLLVST